MEKFRKIMAREELDGFLVISDDNRRYLSGFTGSSGALLITFYNAVLFTDFRYIEQATEESKDYGFTVKEHEPIIWKTISSFLNKNRGEQACLRWGFESDYMMVKDYRYLQSGITAVDLVSTQGLVTELRRIKTEDEIELIEKAVAITDQAWARVWPRIQPGLKEIEIAALFEYEQRKLGASGTSFETIVATGPRSALPHGVAGERILREGDLLVLDGGAVFGGYCSDFTRTIVVGGQLRENRQQEIYDLVLNAQKEALKDLKAGMTGSEGDYLARRIIKEVGYGDKFGHGLGHSLGLAVHEEPRLSPRDDTVLSPGMVLTVEPGVYLPGWGGVRIEDVVVITETGCRNLTRSPKRLIPV